MSVVIVQADKRRVVVAADSAGVSFNPPAEMYNSQIPKVFRSGPWVIGYAACRYVPGIRGPFVIEATAPELRE